MPEFDPYVEWLDIDPALCPPNYYDLLGVMPFEDDRQLIEQAFELRLAHVRSFQTGPRGKFTQDLLNELAQARLCLLNTDARQIYDDSLRQGKVKPPVEIANLFGEAVPPIVDDPITLPGSESANKQSTSSNNPLAGRLPLVYVAGCIVLVFGIWGIAKWARSTKTADASSNGSSENGEVKNSDAGAQPLVPKKNIINEVEVDKGILPGANNSYMFSPSNATLDKPHPAVIDTSDGQLLDQWQPVKSKPRWEFWINAPGHYEAIISYNATTNESFSRIVVEADDKFRKSVKMRTADEMDFFFEEEVVILFREKGAHKLHFSVEGVPGNFRLKSITLRPNRIASRDTESETKKDDDNTIPFGFDLNGM